MTVLSHWRHKHIHARTHSGGNTRLCVASRFVISQKLQLIFSLLSHDCNISRVTVMAHESKRPIRLPHLSGGPRSGSAINHLTAGRISVQLVLGQFLVGVNPCVLFTDWTAVLVWQNVELFAVGHVVISLPPSCSPVSVPCALGHWRQDTALFVCV